MSYKAFRCSWLNPVSDLLFGGKYASESGLRTMFVSVPSTARRREVQVIYASLIIEPSERLMSDFPALLDEYEWIVRLEVVEIAEFLVEGVDLHVEYRLHRLCERQFPSPAEVPARRNDEPFGLLFKAVQIGDENVSVAFLESCHVFPVQ